MSASTFGPTGLQNVHDDAREPYAVVRLDYRVSREELFAALVLGFTETDVDRDPDLLSVAEVRQEVEATLAASSFNEISRTVEQIQAGTYTGPQLRRLDGLRRAMDRAYPLPSVPRVQGEESGARTVTVDTSDHGPVTLVEPFWCRGEHPAEGYRADISHEGDEYPLVVETPCHGEVRIALASLVQRPFSPYEPRVLAAVEFDELHEYDSASLAGLADGLVAYVVGPLHSLIERLQLLEGGES